MAIIKINAEKLGIKKTISVFPSFSLQEKANYIAKVMNDLRIEGIKAEIKAEKEKNSEKEIEEKEETQLEKLQKELESAESDSAGIEKSKEVGDKIFSFLKEALSLKDSQIETAKNKISDMGELGSYVGYVIAKLQNPKMSDEDFNLATNVEEDKDPKKD